MTLNKAYQKQLSPIASFATAVALLIIVSYFIYQIVIGDSEPGVYVVALIVVGFPFLFVAIRLLKATPNDRRSGLLSPFTLRLFAVIWLLLCFWLVFTGEGIGWGAGLMSAASFGLANKRDTYRNERNLFK